MTILTVSVCVE